MDTCLFQNWLPGALRVKTRVLRSVPCPLPIPPPTLSSLTAHTGATTKGCGFLDMPRAPHQGPCAGCPHCQGTLPSVPESQALASPLCGRLPDSPEGSDASSGAQHCVSPGWPESPCHPVPVAHGLDSCRGAQTNQGAQQGDQGCKTPETPAMLDLAWGQTAPHPLSWDRKASTGWPP